MELNNPEFKTTKRNMLILMAVWLLVDIALYVYQKETSTIVRLFLTSALFLMIYQGKKWARQLFLVLSGIALIFSVGMSLYLFTISITVGLLMLLFTLTLSALPSYLVFNEQAKAYFVKREIVQNDL